MKYLAITLAGAMLAATGSSLVIERQSSSSSASDIKAAVYAWRNDTATVSNFLNGAASNSYSSQSAYHSAAVGAYNAELDELIHKGVLDAELPHTNDLEQANTTLVTDGTFGSVVNLLKELKKLNYLQKERIHLHVQRINFGHGDIAGRCKAVLPAISTYFSQASDKLESLDGDSSLQGLQAVPPTACGDS